MNFRTPVGGHLGVSLIGSFSFLFLSLWMQNPLLQSLYASLLFFVGGLFPDLDTGSIPSRWAARIGAITSLAMMYIERPYIAAGIGLGYMLTKIGKHRGWTHSFLLPIAISVASYFYGFFIFGAGLSLGILSHILADDYARYIVKDKNHY